MEKIKNFAKIVPNLATKITVNIDFTKPIPNNYFIAIIIGILSVIPAILPPAYSLYKDNSCDKYKRARIEKLVLVLPILFSIIHVGLFYLMYKYIQNDKYKTWWVLGLLIGLLYPTLGSITGYKSISGIKLYITSFVTYSIIYTFGMNYLFSNI